jgi:hypothetical protein
VHRAARAAGPAGRYRDSDSESNSDSESSQSSMLSAPSTEDSDEPTWPYREKLKLYAFMSKESLAMHCVIEDINEGKPCDARKYSNKAFPTLLRDGFVTERGEPSEGFKQELKAYEKEMQARKARQILKDSQQAFKAYEKEMQARNA